MKERARGQAVKAPAVVVQARVCGGQEEEKPQWAMLPQNERKAVVQRIAGWYVVVENGGPAGPVLSLDLCE